MRNTSNSESNKLTAENLVNQGSNLFSQKDYAKAIECFDLAIELSPNHSLAYGCRADAHLQLGKQERAISDANNAILHDPEYSEAFVIRGIAKTNLMKEEAFDDLQKAIKLQPTARAYNALAVALVKLKKDNEGFQKAVFYSSEAIQKDSRFVKAYLTRGYAKNEISSSSSKYEELVDDFGKAIELDPQNYIAHYHLARIANIFNFTEIAVKNYEKCILLNPLEAAAFYNLGCVHYKLKKYEDAIKSFDTAISISAKDTNAYINRGLAKHKLQRYDQALIDFGIAEKLEPNDPDIYRWIGHSKYKCGDYKSAINNYDKCINLDPVSNEFVFGARAMCKANLGSPLEGILDIYDINKKKNLQITPSNDLYSMLNAGDEKKLNKILEFMKINEKIYSKHALLYIDAPRATKTWLWEGRLLISEGKLKRDMYNYLTSHLLNCSISDAKIVYDLAEARYPIRKTLSTNKYL